MAFAFKNNEVTDKVLGSIRSSGYENSHPQILIEKCKILQLSSGDCPIWINVLLFLDKMTHVHYNVHIMKSKTYTEAREKLSDLIEKVCEDHDPLIITKRRDKAVVMISLEDYESLRETSYLLRSPRNARRLLESIKELEEGRGTAKDLLD